MFNLVPRRKEKKGMVPREADPLGLMRREFDTIFNRFFGGLPLAYAEEWEAPAWGLEVVEEDKAVVVRAEAPGFEVADFDVNVMDDILTITAEHKETNEKAEKKESRAYARLERVITLPPSASTDKVEALYRNGVLELRFPKLPEAAAKKIEVKV